MDFETAGMITANCRWCGEVMQNADAITLHKMVKTHEASCPERPEEQEQKTKISESDDMIIDAEVS